MEKNIIELIFNCPEDVMYHPVDLEFSRMFSFLSKWNFRSLMTSLTVIFFPLYVLSIFYDPVTLQE